MFMQRYFTVLRVSSNVADILERGSSCEILFNSTS